MNRSSLRTPLLCLGLLALAACGGKDKAAPKMPPPEVGVIKATPTDAPLVKDLVGRLSPYRSADVRARVAGVLLQRTYEEGSDVKKGQVLFKIDPAPLRAALEASLATLAQAQATYTNAHISARRIRELAPKGYVSKSDLDSAEAQERSAAAAVKQAQANVDTARINLGYADVTSPIDGRAGQQQVTEGALVGNSDATLLTTVDQIDPLYVNFTLSVDELDKMQEAQKSGGVTLSDQDKSHVTIHLPDGRKYAEQGTLDFSSTTVTPATGAVTMRAKVPNPDRTLLPGMYVTLSANLGERNKIFLVPQQAVQRDTLGAYLLVVDGDGKVERRDITTSAMQGADWIVDSGLKAGDQVIVTGVQKAKEGAPAKAVPWSPDTKTQDSATQAGKAPATASSSK